MPDENDTGHSSLDGAPSNAQTRERSITGSKTLSVEFLEASKAEDVYLKNLDHDNDVNILMGGDGITNRRSQYEFIAQDRIAFEKKNKDFVDHILTLSLRQIIENIRAVQAQIYEALEKMNDLINQADEEIARIQEHLQNITRRHNELNDAIEARYFDKDHNDRYKSKAVADTIAAYEQRTGEKVSDDLPPEMLILILRAQEEFEKTTVIPALENNLVKLDAFRGKAQEQKDSLEEENKRIDQALKAIEADTSLTVEERKAKAAAILEDASIMAVDAQTLTHVAEQEYVDIIGELQEKTCFEHQNTYIEHSNNETAERHQAALEELKNIKPILPPNP